MTKGTIGRPFILFGLSSPISERLGNKQNDISASSFVESRVFWHILYGTFDTRRWIMSSILIDLLSEVVLLPFAWVVDSVLSSETWSHHPPDTSRSSTWHSQPDSEDPAYTA